MLNRAVGRMRIFGKERDFEAFEEVIAEAKSRLPMRRVGMVRPPQSLALRAVAPKGRRLVRVHALVDGHPHPALARGASDGRDRSAVSRAFQVVPDPGRRSSLECAAVCGAKRASGPIWSNGPTPGGGQVFGIASAGTGPDCSTRVR